MKNYLPPFFRIVILLIALCIEGCGLILNGSTQDVPIKTPRGTQVIDEFFGEIPIEYEYSHGDTTSTLNLKRNRSYSLQFVYNGEQLKSKLFPVFEGSAIELDLFYFGIPLLPDLLTGAFNSFEGIALHFPSDSLDPKRTTAAFIEEFDPDKLFKKSVGAILLADVGMSDPLSFVLFSPTQFSLGAGYDLTSNISVMAMWNFSFGLPDNSLLPRESNYSSENAFFSFYQILARYRLYKGFYASLGGGFGKVSVDRLYTTDSRNSRHFLPGTVKTMPEILGSIGYSGKVSYIDLRYQRGFSKIIFSSGEENTFQSISLNFGFNFHF